MLLYAFVPLLALTVVWLTLVWRLFRLLASRHPAKYAQMGQPSLILNNSLLGTLRLLRFVFTDEHDALHDPGVSAQVRLMRAWFVLCAVAFVAFLATALYMLPTR